MSIRIERDLCRIVGKSVILIKKRGAIDIFKKQTKKSSPRNDCIKAIAIGWSLYIQRLHVGEVSLPRIFIGNSTRVVTGGVIYKRSLGLSKLEKKCLALCLAGYRVSNSSANSLQDKEQGVGGSPSGFTNRISGKVRDLSYLVTGK